MTEARRQRPARADQRGAGGKAAKPVARSDPRAEIGRPVDLRHRGAQPVGEREFGGQDEVAAGRAGSGAPRLLIMLIAQKHDETTPYRNRRSTPGAVESLCRGGV